jgi:hypothetical protein
MSIPRGKTGMTCLPPYRHVIGWFVICPIYSAVRACLLLDEWCETFRITAFCLIYLAQIDWQWMGVSRSPHPGATGLGPGQPCCRSVPTLLSSSVGKLAIDGGRIA